jgi:hypothetical protein
VKAEAAAAARRRARVVDEVVLGDESSERGHALTGKAMASGTHRGRRWRHATAGGFFSFKMAICPDGPTDLCCTYWGGDAGARRFDILVDGIRVATERLNKNRPGEFFDVTYALPPQITQQKKHVTVSFRPQAGQIAGGVFACCALRRE